jgi:hypothetical protein
MLARLDNEVIFKKAFTDPFVFRAFVKDILGIDINPPTIETERSFLPKSGSVDIKYDIFAEDPEKRVIVEIQKVEYDHNFDRFLHYHLQGITEQTRSASQYSPERTVYTIVVITAPYKVGTKSGEFILDEVLISKLNPQNLRGVERDLFNHELVFLNPNYRDADTPQNYRDWLDLVYESIHHPRTPHINAGNAGVMRVAELIDMDELTPTEMYEAKKEAGKQSVLALSKKEGRDEMQEQMIINLLKQGVLSAEQIAAVAQIPLEIVIHIAEQQK